MFLDFLSNFKKILERLEVVIYGEVSHAWHYLWLRLDNYLL